MEVTFVPPNENATAAQEEDIADYDEGFVEIEEEEEVEDLARVFPHDDFAGFPDHELLIPSPAAQDALSDPEPAIIFTPDETEYQSSSQSSEEEEQQNLFQKLYDSILSENVFRADGSFDARAALKIVANVKSRLAEAMPSDQDLTKIKEMAAEAEAVLVEKWNEIQTLSESEQVRSHAKATAKAVSKLGKTLMKSLRKIKKSVKKGNFGMGDAWSQIRDGLQSKWDHVLDKYDRTVKKEEAKEEKKKMKNKQAETSSSSSRQPTKNKSVKKIYSSWSYDIPTSSDGNETSSTNGSWMFDRAETRQKARREAERSDWVFKRANDRRRFHQFADAEWHSKRFFNKKCEEEQRVGGAETEEEEEVTTCDDLGEVRIAI